MFRRQRLNQHQGKYERPGVGGPFASEPELSPSASEPSAKPVDERNSTQLPGARLSRGSAGRRAEALEVEALTTEAGNVPIMSPPQSSPIRSLRFRSLRLPAAIASNRSCLLESKLPPTAIERIKEVPKDKLKKQTNHSLCQLLRHQYSSSLHLRDP